jgi:hypothetical protein
LFSTRQLRRNWLQIILCLLLLWQLVWLAIPAIRLVFINNYDELFDFYESLYIYESSWIVRMIMTLVSQASFTLSGLAKALISSWSSGMTWIAALGLLILLSGSSKKSLIISAGFILILAAGTVITAVTGLSASTLAGAISILKFFGWFIIAYVCVSSALLLLICIKNLLKISAFLGQK